MLAVAGLSATRIGFYATAATVLPVIWVAFVLQLRIDPFPRRASERVVELPFLVVLCLAGIGATVVCIAEVFAMLSLADGTNVGFVEVQAGVAISVSMFLFGTMQELLFRIVKRAAAEAEAEHQSASDASAP